MSGRFTTVAILTCAILGLVFVAGCDSIQLYYPSYNDNISVRAFVNDPTPEYYGIIQHHNVTLNIRNDGVDVARDLTVKTYYCSSIAHDCHNNSFPLGDLPPNTTVQVYFEYSNNAIENAANWEYILQYDATSNFPI